MFKIFLICWNPWGGGGGGCCIWSYGNIWICVIYAIYCSTIGKLSNIGEISVLGALIKRPPNPTSSEVSLSKEQPLWCCPTYRDGSMNSQSQAWIKKTNTISWLDIQDLTTSTFKHNKFQKFKKLQKPALFINACYKNNLHAQVQGHMITGKLFTVWYLLKHANYLHCFFTRTLILVCDYGSLSQIRKIKSLRPNINHFECFTSL